MDQTKATLKKRKKRKKKSHQLATEDTDHEKASVFVQKEPPKFEVSLNEFYQDNVLLYLSNVKLKEVPPFPDRIVKMQHFLYV